MATVEVIPAFLASPGDVAEEREDARAVVEAVNSAVGAPFGLRIELYGWERQPPDYGRPQGLINPNVDEAELFIGLLWRMWGSPTGEDTSGFHEEYRRAVDRRGGGDSNPTIWLFFKEIEDGQLRDPGSVLQQVLDFRRSIEANREVLYRTFSSREDWREQLHALLSEFVAKRAVARMALSNQPATASPSVPAADREPTPGAEEPELEAARQQLRGALESAAQHVGEDREAGRPDELTAARVLLASFDWVSRVSTNGVLDTHESNHLFGLRHDLIPTADEQLQLMASMVTGADVRPGWGWLADVPDANRLLVLAFLALTDTRPAVRAGAMQTMGDASMLDAALPDGVDRTQWGTDAFLQRAANDPAPEVQREAMQLLGLAATEEAVAFLRAAADVPQTRIDAIEGLVYALLRRSPREALQLVLDEDPYLPDDLIDALLAHATEYDDELIDTLRAAKSPGLRRLALRIADSSGRLTEEQTAEVINEDGNADTKVVAIDIRLAHGWPVDQEMLDSVAGGLSFAVRGFSLDDDATERIVNQRRTIGEDGLRSELNWYLVQTAAHYEALGIEHFDSFGVQVRRDLDDTFRTFKQDSLAELRRRFPGSDISKLIEDPRYAEEAFMAAALEVLAKRGEPADRERVLRYVDTSNFQVRVSALRALTRVGGLADAEYAVRAALTSEGAPGWRREAARIALALSPHSAFELLDTDEAGVAELAILALPADADGAQALRAALHHRQDDVRRTAVARLAATSERAALLELLQSYTRRGRYFYNVVVWLDRLLYAPRSLRARYREELGIESETVDEA